MNSGRMVSRSRQLCIQLSGYLQCRFAAKAMSVKRFASSGLARTMDMRIRKSLSAKNGLATPPVLNPADPLAILPDRLERGQVARIENISGGIAQFALFQIVVGI